MLQVEVTVNNVGDVFFTFLCISTLISFVFLSLGSAEADAGRGKKLSDYLMASYVKNIHTKNYENLTIFVYTRIENVRDVSFETQCSPCPKKQSTFFGITLSNFHQL